MTKLIAIVKLVVTNASGFRLRDVEQLQAVALLAYDNTLSFEFDRTAAGVSVLLFMRGMSVSRVSGDDGTGI